MKKTHLDIYRPFQEVNKFRDYEIYVDGELEAELSEGEKVEIEVSPGKHTVLAQIDWCKSRELELDLEAGAKEELICGSRLEGWKVWLFLFYLFLRDKFVYLDYYKKEEEFPGKLSEEEDAKKGALNYILQEGVLSSWGLPAGVAMFIIVTIFEYGQYSTYQEVFYDGIRLIGIFALLGLAFGLLKWIFMQVFDYPIKDWLDIEGSNLPEYIFKVGIISWGIPVGVLVFITNTFYRYERYFSVGEIVLSAIGTLGIFILGGVIFGLVMWFIT